MTHADGSTGVGVQVHEHTGGRFRGYHVGRCVENSGTRTARDWPFGQPEKTKTGVEAVEVGDAG